MSGDTTIIVEQDEDGEWVPIEEDSLDIDAIVAEILSTDQATDSGQRPLSPIQKKILESWKDYP